jgi:hypothetical protein
MILGLPGEASRGRILGYETLQRMQRLREARATGVVESPDREGRGEDAILERASLAR